MSVTVIDGPMGTELNARGVSTRMPLWSASALEQAPQTVAQIHREYSLAGATVHTTNTFRTKRRNLEDDWQRMTEVAIDLARQNVGDGLVAGSISPLEDCYQPDRSPTNCVEEHREFAEFLASRCDMLLCETFPHVGEAVVAVKAAKATGVQTWAALTAGPNADLLSPKQMADGARRVVQAGAAAVLVNCTPAVETLPFVVALEQANLGVPIGAYANAGSADDQIGWTTCPEPGADSYLQIAKRWVDAGATIIGGCCGTGPAHIAALASEFAK